MPRLRGAPRAARGCASRRARGRLARALGQLLPRSHAVLLHRHRRRVLGADGRGVREDPATPGTRRRAPRAGAGRGIAEDVDLSSSEELAFDHGVMVPLHLLGTTLPVIPDHRQLPRRACQPPSSLPRARCRDPAHGGPVAGARGDPRARAVCRTGRPCPSPDGSVSTSTGASSTRSSAAASTRFFATRERRSRRRRGRAATRSARGSPSPRRRATPGGRSSPISRCRPGPPVARSRRWSLARAAVHARRAGSGDSARPRLPADAHPARRGLVMGPFGVGQARQAIRGRPPRPGRRPVPRRRQPARAGSTPSSCDRCTRTPASWASTSRDGRPGARRPGGLHGRRLRPGRARLDADDALAHPARRLAHARAAASGARPGPGAVRRRSRRLPDRRDCWSRPRMQPSWSGSTTSRCPR